MFAQNSRYVKLVPYAVTLSDGRVVDATRLPVPPVRPVLAGYHKRIPGERLDLLAARYLQDPTLFWMLCNANGSPVAAALEARPLIGIPSGAA